MSLSSDDTVMTMPVQPANNYNGGMGMWGAGLDLNYRPVPVWLGPQRLGR